MIALVTTCALVFYILAPGILFRFASSLRVRLKLFQRTRTQEATFSVAVALVPFALALCATWHIDPMRHHPFAIADESAVLRQQDYRDVFAILTSSDASKLLHRELAGQQTHDASWAAIGRVLHRQARFLFWYFVFSALEGWFFGYLASKYGDWHLNDEELRQKSTSVKRMLLRLFNWSASKLILPNVSEWHMLLTDFNWPKRDKFFVSVDILQSNEHLYQGRVADYFIDSEGKLSGVLLKNVSRFDRRAFADARMNSANPNAPTRDQYWRNIPSNHFYIGYSSIVNLNVRFAPRDQDLISLADKILRQSDSPAYDVQVEVEDPEREIDPRWPDMYS
jgi:hypothetical protein